MKLVVCETLAAVVLHLREDDGKRFPGGGLDPSDTFCQSEAYTGWDTRIPPPVSPEAARKIVQAPRFCRTCIQVWEEKLRVRAAVEEEVRLQEPELRQAVQEGVREGFAPLRAWGELMEKVAELSAKITR